MPIEIAKPYALFLGDVASPLDAKTATGIAYWRPQDCVGQVRLAGCGADTGLPDVGVDAAAAAGARTLVVGVAPVGGAIAESWVGVLAAALRADLDLAAGLHVRLADVPALADAAAAFGRAIHDIRHPRTDFPVGLGAARGGRRLLCVGTDCAAGKMFAALAVEAEMQRRGMDATFRATGQTGIFIAGEGVCIDAVVSDFVSGAVETLAPANAPGHWDLIEGQGSLFHPGYAAVSLGLLHGAQAEALVLCHRAGQQWIEDVGPPYAVPSLELCAEANLAAARLTSPQCRLAGVCLNTDGLDEGAASAALADAGRRLGVPACDPVRTGVAAIVDGLG